MNFLPRCRTTELDERGEDFLLSGVEFNFAGAVAFWAAQFHLTKGSEKNGQAQEKCARVEGL